MVSLCQGNPSWSHAVGKTVCAATPVRAAQQILKSAVLLLTAHTATMKPLTVTPAMALLKRTVQQESAFTLMDALRYNTFVWNSSNVFSFDLSFYVSHKCAHSLFFRLFQEQWLRKIHCPQQSLTWPSPLLHYPQSLKESKKSWARKCPRSRPRECQSSKLPGCSRNETLKDLMGFFPLFFFFLNSLLYDNNWWSCILLSCLTLSVCFFFLLPFSDVFLKPVWSLLLFCYAFSKHLFYSVLSKE